MRNQRALFAITIVLAFVGGMIASSFKENTVAAQAPANVPASVGRYQMGTFSGILPDGFHHGCYILDTTSGQVWHTGLGVEPQVIAKRLSQ